MTKVPRIRAWRVEKEREVFLTPDGPVIAERGDVVAIAVEKTFGTASVLLAAFDKPEPDDPR